jgi:hypothetical protein
MGSGVMDTAEVLRRIESHGIQLETDGKYLLYKPKENIPKELLALLRGYKTEIIHFLRGNRRRMVVFSHVLDREVSISWYMTSPNVVYVDRTPYTPEEIAKLKNGDPNSIKMAHLLKETFQGTIVDAD